MAAETLDVQRQGAGARRFIYIAIAFPIVMLACGFAVAWLRLGWIGAAILVLVAMGMTAALMRAGNAKARALGCGSPAISRYTRRMLVGSMIYMVVLLGSVYLYAGLQVRGPLLWAAALVTALPVLAMIWAMGRLVVEETDEYLRSRVVRQALFGTGGLLVIATVWGFLEQFMLVPHVPAWAAVPVFAVMMGASAFLPANR